MTIVIDDSQTSDDRPPIGGGRQTNTPGDPENHHRRISMVLKKSSLVRSDLLTKLPAASPLRPSEWVGIESADSPSHATA